MGRSERRQKRMSSIRANNATAGSGNGRVHTGINAMNKQNATAYRDSVLQKYKESLGNTSE